MKPKVFLSHSKKDKTFIEKVANNLRNCGIDVWYDEWEIPPGESIRKKIFDEGITSCDMFFIYLTENSIPSYWVQKELDGAFIHEIEIQNSFLTLFVDQDVHRDKLSIDLKSLNIPKFNDEDYLIPFGKLLSRIWFSYSKNQLKTQAKDNKIHILELEKNNAELQRKILQIEKNSKIDIDSINNYFFQIVFEHNGITKNLVEIIVILKNEIADGALSGSIWRSIQNIFNVSVAEGFFQQTEGEKSFHEKYRFYDFTGELILHGLVEMKTSKDLDQLYTFTNQGIEYIKTITTANS
jgi:TIR domain